MNTQGVRWLFSITPERPCPVPQPVIADLIGRFGPGGSDRIVPAASLEAGISMHVVSGAFVGFQGICAWSAGRRVQLLLDIMGKATPVTMRRADVRVQS